MLKIWNVVLIILTFCSGDLRHLPHPQRASSRRSTRSPSPHRPLFRRLHVDRRARSPAALILYRMPLPESENRLDSVRVARGRVPASTTVLFVALTFAIFLGHDLPGGLRGGDGREDHGAAPFFNASTSRSASLLALPDRGRAADRLAQDVRSRSCSATSSSDLVGALAAIACIPLRPARRLSDRLRLRRRVFVIATIVMEFARGRRPAGAHAGGGAPWRS